MAKTGAPGERNGHAKLTTDQVVSFRERHVDGGESIAALAREFGISATTGSKIATGDLWSHVGGPRRVPRLRSLSRHSPSYCPTDGYELEVSTDGIGRTRVECRACARRKSGRCIDCGAAVEGRAWRCPGHRQAADEESLRRARQRNRETRAAAVRQKLREETPERRAERLAKKKAWRAANPLKVMLQQRRYRTSGKAAAYGREHRRRTMMRKRRQRPVAAERAA